MLKKIISGGQTGVDTAALEAAMRLNLKYSGYCPQGRLNETGTISDRYKDLIEIQGHFQTEQENYDARTRKNIETSDGTLIIQSHLMLDSHIQDGTILTRNEVKAQNKPHLIIGLSDEINENITRCKEWIEANDIVILNIAGPRDSTEPSIEYRSLAFLKTLLQYLTYQNNIKPR